MAWRTIACRPGPSGPGTPAGPKDPPNNRSCPWTLTLEPLRQAGPLHRVFAIRSRHLAAQPRRREDLPGIAEIARIERGPDSPHRLEVVLREHPRHVLRLVGADAVLPRDGSAGL